MHFLLTNHWLLLITSLLFWTTPIALTIHLAVVTNKPNNYKKKIGYIYSSLWAIAFVIYAIIFFS